MDKILWIDNWPEAMQEMLSTFFPELWDNNIRSEIAIFGNAITSENNLSNQVFTDKIDNLNKAAYSEFVDFLLSIDLNVDELMEKYRLIFDNDYDKFESQPQSDIVLDKRDAFQEIENEYNSFQNDKGSFTELGKKIFDRLKLNEYKYVLIDLRLTSYDNQFYNKVYNKLDSSEYDDKKPLMSMILYNYISSIYSKESSSPKPIIYSSYTRPKKLAEEWQKKYTKIFENGENIEIYNRFGQGVLRENTKKLQKVLCS